MVVLICIILHIYVNSQQNIAVVWVSGDFALVLRMPLDSTWLVRFYYGMTLLVYYMSAGFIYESDISSRLCDQCRQNNSSLNGYERIYVNELH